MPSASSPLSTSSTWPRPRSRWIGNGGSALDDNTRWKRAGACLASPSPRRGGGPPVGSSWTSSRIKTRSLLNWSSSAWPSAAAKPSAGASSSASGPSELASAVPSSSGRFGRRRRSASTSPRSNLGRLASSGCSEYQAPWTRATQAASRVDLPKPAPATTVTRRRAPTSSRRRSSSGRSTQAAGSAGGRILLAGVRDRNVVTVASATLLVPSLDGRVSPSSVPTPRGCHLLQPANRSILLGGGWRSVRPDAATGSPPTADLCSVAAGSGPGQHLVKDAGELLREGQESAVVTGKVDHGRPELVGQGHRRAVGELPFRGGPAGAHDPRRRRPQRLDVGPVAGGRADQMRQELLGGGAHPGQLLGRRLPLWSIRLRSRPPAQAGMGHELLHRLLRPSNR